MTENMIDPSTIAPDEPWWVRLPDGVECAAQRDGQGLVSWFTTGEGVYRDAEVTLLHRLIPETAYVAALRRSQDARGDMLAAVAAAVGWDHGTAWPTDLAERVRALRVSRDAWSERAGAAERRADDAERRIPAMTEHAIGLPPEPDPTNPDHLRWAANLLESLSGAGDAWRQWNAVGMRREADRLEQEHTATARRDQLTAKVRSALAVKVPPWDRDNLTAVVVDAILAADAEVDQ